MIFLCAHPVEIPSFEDYENEIFEFLFQETDTDFNTIDFRIVSNRKSNLYPQSNNYKETGTVQIWMFLTAVKALH